MWTDFSSVLSQYTRVTDGQTDRIRIAIPRVHYMQRGNKRVNFFETVYVCMKERFHAQNTYTVRFNALPTCHAYST